MNTQADERSSWWRRLTLDVDMTAQWEIGPLRLAVQHLPFEWRVAYGPADAWNDQGSDWSFEMDSGLESAAYPTVERYVFRQASHVLRVTPALADRSIVTRPVVPFNIPAAEEATIYLSSPLWVHIEAGDPPQTLQYIPIQRPPDTWLGPSTREGELCYASRTFGRLNLSEIPIRPHRAITRVLLRNVASSTLLVERLSLPVPYLSLFATQDGVLYTESVTMQRSRDSSQADFEIDSSLPVDAQEVDLVAPPRQRPGEKLSIRAFGAILRDAARWS